METAEVSRPVQGSGVIERDDGKNVTDIRAKIGTDAAAPDIAAVSFRAVGRTVAAALFGTARKTGPDTLPRCLQAVQLSLRSAFVLRTIVDQDALAPYCGPPCDRRHRLPSGKARRREML